jgi:putative restriction endonuclease
MRFWWVNQNQTARQEVGGGYMWSPKRNKNGARNTFYENMRECAPGDVVFSYVDTRISNLGVVTSFCEESPKPEEFAAAGQQWDEDGWKVLVDYRPLGNPIRPAAHMDVISPTLPEKYSPIQADGRGNQVYLARVPEAMADVLLGLIGGEADSVLAAAEVRKLLPEASSGLMEERADAIETEIGGDPAIPETEKQSLVKSRRGQGLFRDRVAAIEPHCRVTGISNLVFRIASHIKPWSKCENQERLDGHNGLLLAPHIDHLFDNGFISFADDGTLLISPAADRESLEKMGVPCGGATNVGSFTVKQQEYLAFHRAEVFRKAATGVD